MPSSLTCSSCRRKLTIPDSMVGKSLRCPKCKAHVEQEVGTGKRTAMVIVGFVGICVLLLVVTLWAISSSTKSKTAPAIDNSWGVAKKAVPVKVEEKVTSTPWEVDSKYLTQAGADTEASPGKIAKVAPVKDGEETLQNDPVAKVEPVSAPAGNGVSITKGGPVNVKGYTNKNGVYVAPYTRAAPGTGVKRK